ncbi:murein biosynthesis integral membrane protein MurJ [Wenzhouxiangella marina]|uniref:Probable lipid II flippase MurJ n=1 Tax=Wenzhouxiangella marina TaxID=1579979 RepID=A0A0K0XXT6_9GAMM|nr:murein biosynthesis integral membrane protein MurJ [Wenzhouxiangella marina]AKS42514.1 Putative lipid II flippase MurJ [Wenzhouxiangella marina]
MTLVSRLLGLVRDIVIARWFGASAATDAFVAAFKIPNFLRRLFAEGSFSLAFVPVLSEYKERGDHEALRSLIDATTGVLLAVLLVITAIGVLAAPWVISLFAPGFRENPAQFALATEMLRVTFPYLMLIALTALAGGILNTLGRFALPALTPALLNVSLIVAAVVFSAQFEEPIKALAWGVLVAGLLQLGFLLPSLARHGVLPRPRPDFRHPGVRRILRLMVPTLFGSSVAQISLLLDVLIASLLFTGSISWLYYADRMMEFPLGLFGVALSTVILPALSGLHAGGQSGRFRRTMDWALLLGVVVGIPAAVGLAVLAEPVIIALFQYGAFDPESARMAALALMVYCLGLPAFMGVKILAPGYFSRQDTATPVKIAIIALSTNMLLNVTYVLLLAAWLSGWDFSGGLFETLAAQPGVHVGLALASASSAWLNAGLLWRGLRKLDLAPTLPGIQWLRVALASLVMGGLVAWLMPSAEALLEFGLWTRLAWLGVGVIAGGLVYGLTLLLLGLSPRALLKPSEEGS